MRAIHINKRNVKILYHTLLWMAYVVVLIYFFSAHRGFDYATKRAFHLIIPQILLVYLNTEILIPRLFQQKRYLVYSLALIFTLVALYFYFKFTYQLIPFDRSEFPSFRGRPSDGPKRGLVHRGILVFNLVESIAILLISTVTKITSIALKAEKESIDLKNQHLQSELKFLKSQINPHFLFNALNNIYALAITRSPDTPDKLLELSEMLRYIIYDCQEDTVEVGKEIQYIRHYISLQKLKDDKIQNIKFQTDVDDLKAPIAPMLLLPFVENTFKHGLMKNYEKGWVYIKLEVRDRALTLIIRNNIPDGNKTPNTLQGVGLQNVQKRLNLIYPGRHDLDIKNENREFLVRLTILL